MSRVSSLLLAVFLFILVSPMLAQTPPSPQLSQYPDPKAKDRRYWPADPAHPLLESLQAPTAKSIAGTWIRESDYRVELTFKDGLTSFICRDSKDEKQYTRLTGQYFVGSDGIVLGAFSTVEWNWIERGGKGNISGEVLPFAMKCGMYLDRCKSPQKNVLRLESFRGVNMTAPNYLEGDFKRLDLTSKEPNAKAAK